MGESDGESARSPYATQGCRAELAISSMCSRACCTASLFAPVRMRSVSAASCGMVRWPRVWAKTVWFASGSSWGQIGRYGRAAESPEWASGWIGCPSRSQTECQAPSCRAYSSMLADESKGQSAATPASRVRTSAPSPLSMAAAMGPMYGALLRIPSMGFRPAQMKCTQVR